MIAWGSATAGTDLTSEEHEAFEEVLAGHAWVRVFPGAFVVALIYDGERLELSKGLSRVAQELNGGKPTGSRVRVLVSPAIPKGSGAYTGWAAKDVWPALNKRSIE
jgi:hypothetical protein